MFAFLFIQTDLMLLRSDVHPPTPAPRNSESGAIKDKWGRQREQFENSESEEKRQFALPVLPLPMHEA